MPYASAQLIGARQFHAQEQQRRLVENQDDHEVRLGKLSQRADDVDARYGEMLERNERALAALSSQPEPKAATSSGWAFVALAATGASWAAFIALAGR